ncbi:MAG: tryptophan synthase subunit alpha [Candidatus Omnitrophica bacterium]|nr:tryptophan synthase subunit alpha [Candidatus Omnitrophota bacterium]
MINRIDKKFQELRKRGERALIFYLTVGYPDLATFTKLLFALERSGADLIELGIPFSDPVADGLTIQKTSQVALKQKITLKKTFSLAKDLDVNIPLLLMTYYNPVYQYGLKKFADSCKRNGIEGVIVPDLPPEEANPLRRALKRHNLDLIFLIAPTSPEKRIKMISNKSKGFIYYVSLTGVTGAREKLPKTIRLSLNKIRKFTKRPICVGFGISKPFQAREIGKYSDGIIIGSALLNIVEKYKNKRGLIKKVEKFASEIKETLKG